MKIYQIYYKDEQLSSIDSCCIPYDNSKDISREYEYRVIKEIYDSGLEDDYTGVLSWSFRQKTQRSVQDFKNLILANSGYDCYALNPYHGFIQHFGNVWIQGECHKGITAIAQDIFNEANYNISLDNQTHKVDRSTFCNYWIANKQFFNAYMEFTLPIYNLLKQSEKYKEKLFDEYGKGYFPYIMERLFTTFTHYNLNFKIKVF